MFYLIQVWGTSVSYKGMIKNYIIPRLGKYRLGDLDTLTIQKFISGIFNEQKLCRKYVRSILVLVREAFKYAVHTAKLMPYNIALEAKVPKETEGIEISQNKNIKHLPTQEDIRKLLSKLRYYPSKYYGILISYYTGLRISETYGLTWDCVDLDNQTITVNKIVKVLYSDDAQDLKKDQYSGTTFCLGKCKSNASRRTIRIGDELTKALKEYKIWQEQNKIKYGYLYHYYYLEEVKPKANEIVYKICKCTSRADLERPLVDFVLVKECGEYKGNSPGRSCNTIGKKLLGFDFKFHGLRHYHATQLVDAGASLKDVQDRLGHAQFTTTMDCYVDNTNNMKYTSVELYEQNNAFDHERTNPEREDLMHIWKTIKHYKHSSYYKEANISVCDEWMHDFESFYEWSMNSKYFYGSKLKRKNKAFGYSPDNCFWGY